MLTFFSLKFHIIIQEMFVMRISYNAKWITLPNYGKCFVWRKEKINIICKQIDDLWNMCKRVQPWSLFEQFSFWTSLSIDRSITHRNGRTLLSIWSRIRYNLFQDLHKCDWEFLFESHAQRFLRVLFVCLLAFLCIY